MGTYIGEGAGISDGVGEDDPCCSLIVCLSDVFESFLACGIPYLKFQYIVPQLQSLHLKINPYR